MIEHIFRALLPQNGLAVREEQIGLCHEMLDALFTNKIALSDAGVGIGKTHAYIVACVLWQRYRPIAVQQPVVISTSSVALQEAILEEYIPFLSRVLLQNDIIGQPLRAVVRKGKERFVCDMRLAERMTQLMERRKMTGSARRWKAYKNIAIWTRPWASPALTAAWYVCRVFVPTTARAGAFAAIIDT